MSRITASMSLFLCLLLLHGIVETEAAPPAANIGQFFNKVGDKIAQTAQTIKEYLVELFYRFRAFFMGHSDSTHQEMTTRGCGYAADDKPAVYHKQTTIAKIRGGGDAIWHTW